MERILGQYLYQKDLINPLNGKKLPKSKRIESMYAIVQNNVYGENYSNDERIFASSLITEILKETEN